VENWLRVLPFIHAVDQVFQTEAPDRYAAQKSACAQTPQEFVIPGTCFTTATINLNFRTAVHRDAGDLAEGLGVMSVLDAGTYDGCFLCFPKWRVAVDMRCQDVLLADVHEWHGNTPFVGVEGEYERVSTVLYFRRQMLKCGPLSQ
jgi:hypothetical protein